MRTTLLYTLVLIGVYCEVQIQHDKFVSAADTVFKTKVASLKFMKLSRSIEMVG